jgi:hypothetical protein
LNADIEWRALESLILNLELETTDECFDEIECAAFGVVFEDAGEIWGAGRDGGLFADEVGGEFHAVPNAGADEPDVSV